MATATKDMWAADLIEPWKGDSNSIPVTENFESIDEATEMVRLSSKDKVRLAALKLKGAARVFYSAQLQLKADDVSYENFRTAFVDRFKEKHTDRYHYARAQNASQEKNGSPELFLDRLRKLCQWAISSSSNPVEQTVINQEAERRLLAAFINGIYISTVRNTYNKYIDSTQYIQSIYRQYAIHTINISTVRNTYNKYIDSTQYTQ